MRQPPLDYLMGKVDSKYTLVVAVARRAREIMDSCTIEESTETKPVSSALVEMAEDRLEVEVEA